MKKILSLFLALTMVLTMVACGQSNAPAAEDSANSDQIYPMTLTDQAGREVTINECPQRLISSYYITTSLLMALGLEDRMVGIENDADKRPLYALSAPELLDLPWVGTAKELDMEGCTALEPDLAILPMKLQGSVETLEALGITVLLVNPESQELLREMISLVAEATNTVEQGQALLDHIDRQEKELAEVVSGVETPSVYLSGNSSMLKTAGNAMYQSDMIAMAGGVNVAAEITDTYWAEISYEQLLTWDPDYIILASAATYTVEDVLNDPNLADCTAVVNGNVYHLPDEAEAWDSPVPGSFLGAVWLANVLHPDRVTAADCADRMDDYYETFYDFTYSEIN